MLFWTPVGTVCSGMTSIEEADLVLRCESELRKAKEDVSRLSEEVNTLRTQKEEIVLYYKTLSDNYHLATQLSETYTLDSFDPSRRHDIDCTCYIETNKQLLDKFGEDYRRIGIEIGGKIKQHSEASKRLSNATRRLEILNKRLLQVQQAVEQRSIERLKFKHLENRKDDLQRKILHTEDETERLQYVNDRKQLLHELFEAEKDLKTSRRLTQTAQQLLARYKGYLLGRTDPRGRLIQKPSTN